ncbi:MULTISPECIES: hypothetical protein [unclassified Brevundimonas]|uniref:hypothetical protein n=1 Tax=unclassified Brevundimonas TaxID=2622653 RepID=UPI0006F53425|nr:MULTISPECIES: hypothetical protein [unclassified Brevundimonas]
MKRAQVGVRIARQIHTTEHAVDRAMVAASELLQTMLDGRRDAAVGADVGHAEISDVVASLAQLNGARGLVVRSHGGLAQMAETLGVSWRMEGPGEDKNPLAPMTIAANG